MGSCASKGGGGGSNRNSAKPEEKFTVIKDDYGRDVKVFKNIDDISADKEIWTSGGFSRDGKHYAVFATIKGYSVDKDSLEAVQVSLDDLAGITGVGGWKSWTTSKEADAYVKKYDKPKASGRVKRGVEKAKAFSDSMKKLGR